MSESGLAPTFDEVYQREFDYVWRNLGRFGVPPADLPDAAHDVFLVVHRRWAELDHARPVRPFLFGIVRRVAAAARRRARPADSSAAADEPAHAPDHAERDLLWRALAALDDDRVAVLALHDLEGHTAPAIAEQLDIPVNTVHSRLRLARADLLAAVRRLSGSGGTR